MGLKILKNEGGEFRRIWYGRLNRNGRKVDIKLDVDPIAGTIPETASGQWDKDARGDDAFEASRKEAERAFNALIKGDGKRRKTLEKLENERRALTGQGFGRTSLASLFPKWEALMRQHPVTDNRREMVRATFSSFATFADTFARKNGKSCTALEDVTPEMAGAFFEKIKTSCAWETAKGRFSLLKNAWKRFARSTEPNPFEGVILRGGSKGATARISRVPLTLDQAKRLFEIVREKSPALFPLVACVATTGMRLGDAVALKWADVVLERNPAERKRGRFGTIGVGAGLETAKTGARVVLPIIEPFASVLAELDEKRDDRDVYVFPAELARYNHVSKSEKTGRSNFSKRGGLFLEIKPFFALAVADNTASEAEAAPEETREPKTLAEILELIKAAHFAPTKAERLAKVATERLAGFTAKKIGEDLGLSAPIVSMDLKALEELTGVTLRNSPKARRKAKLGTSKRDLLKFTRKGHGAGRNAASIYGWHSLRATFVVLAIEAGVPLAYVEKAVGHSTAKMTLQYFNPTGHHAAEAIGKHLGQAFAAISAPETLEAFEVSQPPAPVAPVAPVLTAEAIFDALPEAERKKLTRLALERAGMI